MWPLQSSSTLSCFSKHSDDNETQFAQNSQQINVYWIENKKAFRANSLIPTKTKQTKTFKLSFFLQPIVRKCVSFAFARMDGSQCKTVELLLLFFVCLFFFYYCFALRCAKQILESVMRVWQMCKHFHNIVCADILVLNDLSACHECLLMLSI